MGNVIKITQHTQYRYLQRIIGITDYNKISRYLDKLNPIIKEDIKKIYKDSICIYEEKIDLMRNIKERYMYNEKHNIIIICLKQKTNKNKYTKIKTIYKPDNHNKFVRYNIEIYKQKQLAVI